MVKVFEVNVELADILLPYGKWVYIAGVIGRVLLLIVSRFRPGICKVYMYYELALNVTD